MSAEFLTERHGPVLLMTLNRPRLHNALNLAMATGLAAALEELDRDPELAAGVLTGAAPSFCSGIDLKAFAAGELPEVEGRGLGGLTEAPPRKPLIAAAEGYVLAGGFELALACDFIVAADDARFGLPEVQRGQVAAAGGLVRLPRRLPHAVANEMALTGDPIDAPRAAALGLVSRLTPPGAAASTALEVATRIAAASPFAVSTTKRILQLACEGTESEAWTKQRPLVDSVLDSEDALEGAHAFAEKRLPRWSNR